MVRSPREPRSCSLKTRRRCPRRDQQLRHTSQGHPPTATDAVVARIARPVIADAAIKYPVA